MRWKVLLLTAMLSMASAVGQSDDQNNTMESCDYDGDGNVNETEADHCASASGDPHPCDHDQDGNVNRTEAERCEEEHSDDSDDEEGTEATYCYSFSTGGSDDACEEYEGNRSSDDGYEYEEGEPVAECDFNEDGNVTRDEWGRDECEQAIHDHYEDEFREQRRIAIERARAAGVVGGAFEVRDAVDQEQETEEGVKVRIQHNVATAASAPGRADVKFTFDAELEEGRTFVMDINRSLVDGEDFTVRYFTQNDDLGIQVEGTIQQASGLEDILDPSDDEGPEYWWILDSQGLHFMVSIPSWSVHSVALEADAGGSEAFDTPGPGLPLVTVGLLGAAAALRRRT